MKKSCDDTGARCSLARMSEPETQSAPPPPVSFFRPNRGWFLAAAGVLAVWTLDRLDAPLWLAITTLVVLIACAAIWPWIEATKKRQSWFWLLLMLYAAAVVVIVAISARSAPNEAKAEQTTPTPQPTLEEVKPPEIKADEPKPNIIVVGYGKPPTIYDPSARIFTEGFAGQGVLAVVAEFRNAHERGKELSEAKEIRAHISYEPFEFYEKLGKGIKNPENSTSGFANVDDGVWLGEAQPLVNFARGETKTLILAVQSPDGTFAAYSHPIELRAGISVPFPRLRMLTADKYVVKVEITGGVKGEIAELYHFTITLRPEFTIFFG